MARGRMLDRSYTKSKKLNALSRDHRYMYACILPYLDKAGRIEAEPIVLKANVFRWTDVKLEEIAPALAAMESAGLVTLYADEDNAAILQWVDFDKHNTPNHREAESPLPGPDGQHVVAVYDEAILDARGAPQAPPRVGPGENVNDNVNGERKRRTEAQADPDSPEARFERLATTGKSEQAETARTRATIRRVAGPVFASKHEDSMPAWSRWGDDQLRSLWAAADPHRWEGEERKRREWLYVDLLNEDRHPQGPKPDHGSLLRKYRGVEGVKDGKRFEVVGTDLNGQMLMTDVAGYLTPAQVEEARQCLPN